MFAVPPLRLKVPVVPPVPVEPFCPSTKVPPPGPDGEFTVNVPPPTVRTPTGDPPLLAVFCPNVMVVTSNVPVSNETVLVIVFVVVFVAVPVTAPTVRVL